MTVTRYVNIRVSSKRNAVFSKCFSIAEHISHKLFYTDCFHTKEKLHLKNCPICSMSLLENPFAPFAYSMRQNESPVSYSVFL